MRPKRAQRGQFKPRQWMGSSPRKTTMIASSMSPEGRAILEALGLKDESVTKLVLTMAVDQPIRIYVEKHAKRDQIAGMPPLLAKVQETYELTPISPKKA